jgi:ABC-type antimicrobial peptide transport system ATPase subunit
VACGGRAALKALLLNGRPIVEDDAIPGLDLDAMRHDALAAVRTLQQRAAV